MTFFAGVDMDEAQIRLLSLENARTILAILLPGVEKTHCNYVCCSDSQCIA